MKIEAGCKIKICHIITRMDWGGSPDILRMICERLSTDEFQTTLITGPSLHASRKTQKFFRAFSDQVICEPFLIRDISPFFDFFALIKLYLLIRRGKYDIVHTHTAKAGMLGRIAARLAGVKVIVHTSHGHNFYGYFGPLMSGLIINLERWAASLTNKIIVLTELEKNDLIEFKVASLDKIEKIHTAVEAEEQEKAVSRDQFDLKNDDIVIGMVGRLEPIKGVSYFIEAGELLCGQHENLKFVLVGEGSLKKMMEERVRNKHLENRILFAGWRDDVPAIMPMFDILVLPSLNEAVGLVLIEAQRIGVPVVAAKVGGIPEMVKDGSTGILIAPENVPELVKAIEILALDKDKRIAMGEKAKAFVKDRFSPHDLVEKAAKIYKELLKDAK